MFCGTGHHTYHIETTLVFGLLPLESRLPSDPSQRLTVLYAFSASSCLEEFFLHSCASLWYTLQAVRPFRADSNPLWCHGCADLSDSLSLSEPFPSPSSAADIWALNRLPPAKLQLAHCFHHPVRSPWAVALALRRCLGQHLGRH